MAKIIKRAFVDQEIHDKQWGYEIWIENLPEYCGKALHFKKYLATSLHFHVKKKETMYLVDGSIEIKLIDPETALPYSVMLVPGDSILIPPGQSHQILAHEDSVLHEFSTHHEDSDSYRITRDIQK